MDEMISTRRARRMAGLALTAGLLLSPVTGAGQTIETEVEAARKRLEAARAAHLQLIAPQHFERAAEKLGEAEDRYKRGGKIDDIRRRLKEVSRDLGKCEGLQEVGMVLLRTPIEARADALTSNAPEFAPRLWAEAEEAVRRAGRKVEDGDQNGARREAGKTTELYRQAELQSIRVDVLGKAKALRVQAVEAKAEERAAATLARADGLLAEAERVLQGDRYERGKARELAGSAGEEYRHAIQIAGESLRIEKDRKRAPEQLILDHEAELARVAEALGFESRFSEGMAPVAEQSVAAIQSLIEDRNGLETRLEQARAQIDTLESQLSSLVERDVKLQQREKRERTLRDIRSIFTPAEAEVLLKGDQLIVRFYGLSFPSGSAEIRPENFSLLTKLQRVLREFPRAPVSIEGNTDSQGDEDYNQSLSQNRANAVREYLLANMNIEPEWLTAVGYGENRPIANNETADGRAKNRRIDVVIDLPPS